MVCFSPTKPSGGGGRRSGGGGPGAGGSAGLRRGPPRRGLPRRRRGLGAVCVRAVSFRFGRRVEKRRERVAKGEEVEATHRELLAFEKSSRSRDQSVLFLFGTPLRCFFSSPIPSQSATLTICSLAINRSKRERRRRRSRKKESEKTHLALQDVKDVVGQVAARRRRHRRVGGLGGEARVAPGVGRGFRGELAVRVVLQFF